MAAFILYEQSIKLYMGILKNKIVSKMKIKYINTSNIKIKKETTMTYKNYVLI